MPTDGVDEKSPGGEDEVDGAEGADVEEGTAEADARADAQDDADGGDADELDDAAAAESEDAATAAAAAAAAGGSPAATTVPAKPVRYVALHPQARDGLIRCLQARIASLDANLAHASEVAAKDAFYSRWPNVVSELRAQALKRLEELQRS